MILLKIMLLACPPPPPVAPIHSGRKPSPSKALKVTQPPTFPHSAPCLPSNTLSLVCEFTASAFLLDKKPVFQRLTPHQIQRFLEMTSHLILICSLCHNPHSIPLDLFYHFPSALNPTEFTHVLLNVLSVSSRG